MVALSLTDVPPGPYRFPLRVVFEDRAVADTAVFLYVRGQRLSPVRVRLLGALALAGVVGIVWLWWRRVPREAD